MRLLSQHPNAATVEDCKAHRCPEHQAFEDLLNARGPDASECAVCVAQGILDALVDDTIAPIVAAYAAAEPRLKLLGGHHHPSIVMLMGLLTALSAKLAEKDFELVARRVVPTAPGSNEVN